jgi:hypothetical protein
MENSLQSLQEWFESGTNSFEQFFEKLGELPETDRLSLSKAHSVMQEDCAESTGSTISLREAFSHPSYMSLVFQLAIHLKDLKA